MSLVPRDSLIKILEDVSKMQSHARDQLSLAIPMDEILSYYEAQHLTDVVTIKEGLLMKIAIPLASRQTSFTVFHAIPVPMPQYEKDKAIMWKTSVRQQEDVNEGTTKHHYEETGSEHLNSINKLRKRLGDEKQSGQPC